MATTPTTPLTEWDYQTAVTAVTEQALATFAADAATTGAASAAAAKAAATAASTAYDRNAAYLAGDHWQDGETWIGPNGGDAWATVYKAQVERQFVPVGVIGEVLDRVANALLKTEAAVTFAPVQPAEDRSAAAQAQAAEADAMLALVSQWWDRVRLWESARLAVKRSRALGHGVLQLWLSTASLDKDADGAPVLPTDKSLSDAFRLIELAAPDPKAAALITDPATGEPVAVVLGERVVQQKVERYAQLWRRLSALDGTASLSVVTILEQGAREEYTLPLTHLSVAEMAAPLLITEAIRKQQAQLDFGSSMLGRLMETAGFPERYILNGEPAGYWSASEPPGVDAPITKLGENGQTLYLWEETRTLGAATTNEVAGLADTGKDGTVRATPSVYIKEPTAPDGTITAKSDIRATMLMACKQGHVLSNGDAAPSGYSREQARAEFEDDLASTKPPLEGMLRAILEAAVAWALTMAGGSDAEAGIGPDFLARFRVVVTAHADSGPLSPEERQQIRDDYTAGLRSRPAALAALGVEDVGAEVDALDADPLARLSRMEKAATVVKTWTDAGLGITEAIKAVGLAAALPEDVVRALLAAPTFAPGGAEVVEP